MTLALRAASSEVYRALLRFAERGAVLFALLCATCAVACGSSRATPGAAQIDHATRGSTALAQAEHRVPAPPDEPASPLPVEADDAVLGKPGALVTLIAFVDYECPFCARAHRTLAELIGHYDRSELRIVYKNNPLPFHPAARPAARAAQAVLAVAGPAVYFAYAARLFEDQRSLGEARLIALAEEAGVSRETFLVAFRSADRDREIDRDAELAQSVGAVGTPSFRLNGVALNGAQPLDAFVELVERELEAARALLASGTPKEHVYARRVEENLRPAPLQPAPGRRATAEQDDAERVYRVPVGGSATRGPADALVTIVEFQDFQCPFCKRVQPTIDEIFRRYPGRVRLVFKHRPLPFHERAEPAAVLTLEARAQRGDAGFWRATELLWDKSPALEHADLMDVARRVGLNLARVETALAGDAHRAALALDSELADDVGARGTPHFFVNGRRLVGAQPVEKFVALVDAELAKAAALVKSGVAKRALYEHLMKGAGEKSR